MAGRRLRRDAGMVSAELAAAFPAAVLVLGVLLAAFSYGLAASSAQEAARLAARSAARGESDATVRQLVERTAPGASVQVGGDATVEVRVSVPVRGPAAVVLPDSVTAGAVAQRETTDGS